MNPRMRRLIADGEALANEYAGHPHVEVTPIGYEPFESYRVSYRLQGVSLGADQQPAITGSHRVLLQLGAGYPRERPLATTETPIFHPNFGPRVGEEICIGDYWSPARTLADIIATIGELIQYRQYNVRSPLNAVAARWAAEHEDIFPIGDVGLYQAEPSIVLAVPAAPLIPANEEMVS